MQYRLIYQCYASMQFYYRMYWYRKKLELHEGRKVWGRKVWGRKVRDVKCGAQRMGR